VIVQEVTWVEGGSQPADDGEHCSSVAFFS